MTPMSLVHLVIWVMPIFPRPSYQLRLLILKNSIDHPAVLGPYFRWGFFGGRGGFFSVDGRRELDRGIVRPHIPLPLPHKNC